MKQRGLKQLRVIVALIYFIGLSAVFLDYREWIPLDWKGNWVAVQFLPSLIHAMTGYAAALGTMIVLILLTFLLGRIYCSAICPLGILQDLTLRIIRRFKRMKFRYRAPSLMRYGVLVTVGLTLPFTLGVLNLIEPYSQFGRIATHLVKPAVIQLNNALAGLFDWFGSYAIVPVSSSSPRWGTVGITVIFWSVLIILVIRRGRIFCNTVCPAGTVLSFISRSSRFRIRIDPERCNGCGRCGGNCKTECIDSKIRSVDASRCIVCCNCMNECPAGAISYRFSGLKQRRLASGKPNLVDSARRVFLITSVSSVALLPAVAPGSSISSFAAAPPGAGSVDDFMDKCTACQACVSVCPTGVLKPAFLQRGFSGMMQPYMAFQQNFCNYSCTSCGEVCPTGAIRLLPLEKKQVTRIGIARFHREQCVVISKYTDCIACGEHCPTKALKVLQAGERLVEPHVDDALCIGCGACEYACPVRPRRAITIEPLNRHEQAKPPDRGKSVPEETITEFPF